MRARTLLRPRLLWDKLHVTSPRRAKLTRPHLQRLLADGASPDRTLVVHVESVGHERHFPDRVELPHPVSKSHPDAVRTLERELAGVASGSYPAVVCMGLLEHVPDPQWLVDELHRILAPGGRAIVSASAAFTIHEGPNDYFHFTPFGFERLFSAWSGFEVLRGSSQPFETIAILLQRILLQTRMLPPARLLVELLIGVIRRLDRFVVRQYDNFGDRRPERQIDSVLPSNIQAIVVK